MPSGENFCPTEVLYFKADIIGMVYEKKSKYMIVS